MDQEQDPPRWVAGRREAARVVATVDKGVAFSAVHVLGVRQGESVDTVHVGQRNPAAHGVCEYQPHADSVGELPVPEGMKEGWEWYYKRRLVTPCG